MGEPTLQELLRGKGAHADPFACVEDLSPELAGKKVAGYPHSIWQILWHVNYWIDYEIQRISGRAPAYPEHASAGWPTDSAGSEQEWLSEVARFALLMEDLNALAQARPEALDRPVQVMHPSQSGKSSTVRAVLWQIVAHNSYHVGQIVMLRQCLGAWPARKGGDTW